jgi:hypothetical protein
VKKGKGKRNAEMGYKSGGLTNSDGDEHAFLPYPVF